MKIQILNRWNASVIFECEADSMRIAVELAVQRRVSLSAANLRAADLSAADLRAANLSAADLSAANLSAADLSAADLSAANLSAANLSAANLSAANLSAAKEDFLTKLAKAKNEAVGLYKALMDGGIDGSCYTGKCACFCGTIANLKGINYQDLPTELGIEPNGSSPVEVWFAAIRKGDTPNNNPVSAVTKTWMEDFFATHGIAVPKREVVWSVA